MPNPNRRERLNEFYKVLSPVEFSEADIIWQLSPYEILTFIDQEVEIAVKEERERLKEKITSQIKIYSHYTDLDGARSWAAEQVKKETKWQTVGERILTLFDTLAIIHFSNPNTHE